MNADFDYFIQQVCSVIVCLGQSYTANYWYGRDLAAEGWYASLFLDMGYLEKKSIVACKENSVLISADDWAGIVNKWKRKVTRYYESLELVPGEFYSIVVPEFFGGQCFIYDLDGMEKIIMDKQSTPLTLVEFFYKRIEYVDDYKLSGLFERYVDLIIVFVKQLVLRKVARPETIQIF